jgi:dihydroflavonol-4-reductase
MTHRSDLSPHDARSQPMGAGSPLRRVAVTGATGLLGSAAVAELLSRGIEVVALARNEIRARQLLGNRDGLHLVLGDMLDVRALEPQLRGVDAIIHTAAYFREYYQHRFDLALLGRTNVAAVGELIDVARDAGVPVVVYVSSAGTLAPGSSGHPADEDTGPRQASMRNAYYASKVRAERLIEALRPTASVRIPVVVPAWMWGPGDAAPSASGQMFLSVANRAMTGVPRVSAHMVDARDVAAACVRAAELGEDRRYVVAGARHELPAVCAKIAELCDVPVPRPLAARIALAGSGVVQLSDRLRRRPALVTTRGTCVLIDMDRQWISSARAQAELGVTFRPVDETLHDEAAWFRERGLIATDLVSTGRR